jgi:hypothetical protein
LSACYVCGEGGVGGGVAGWGGGGGGGGGGGELKLFFLLYECFHSI